MLQMKLYVLLIFPLQIAAEVRARTPSLFIRRKWKMYEDGYLNLSMVIIGQRSIV
jgi:hypothetical protein